MPSISETHKLCLQMLLYLKKVTFNKNDFFSTNNGLFCPKLNAGDSIARISRSIRTAKGYYPLLSRDPGLVFLRIAKPSRNTPREWLLMRTRHVVDINLAYTMTKRKIYTNVEYNFHDRFTYLTLQVVYSFLGR